MSVLIKGMDELPEDGQMLVVKHVDGKAYIKRDDVMGFSMELVQLPDKHGDLIDRDAFRADYGMNADCADCEKECRGKTRACEYDRIYSKMDFCSWLDVADVVIEAEDTP